MFPKPPPCRAHASCSSGLHRNLCPLVSNSWTPDFLSRLRLLLVQSEAQPGLRPVPAFPHSSEQQCLLTSCSVIFHIPHGTCKGHWKKPTGFCHQQQSKMAALSLLVGSLSHPKRQDGKGLKGSTDLQLAAESLARTKDATGETLMAAFGLVPLANSECGCGQLPGVEQARVPRPHWLLAAG